MRATFRLSEDCIDAISILSAQLGIKQKSVFDHLMEDIQILKDMASELENTEFDRHQRVQKTSENPRAGSSILSLGTKISSTYDIFVGAFFCLNRHINGHNYD